MPDRDDARPFVGDSVDADSAVPAVLLEHPRPLRQPPWEFPRELGDRVHTMRVCSERKVAHVDQHVLGAHAQDRVRMRAHEDPLRCNALKHRVQTGAAATALDWVVPDQHAPKRRQLRFDFDREVVVVDDGLDRDASLRERVEERCETIGRSVGSIAGPAGLRDTGGRNSNWNCSCSPVSRSLSTKSGIDVCLDGRIVSGVRPPARRLRLTAQRVKMSSPSRTHEINAGCVEWLLWAPG
jgi:hypothetical protein